MKKTFALLVLAALTPIASFAHGARLGDHKQSLIDAAPTPEMRALLEAAE